MIYLDIYKKRLLDNKLIDNNTEKYISNLFNTSIGGNFCNRLGKLI